MAEESELCGQPYAGVSGDVLLTCTQAPKHPHRPWHRNGSVSWLALDERAYLRGSADRQWRELAVAVIRGQLAPGDVHRAFWWLGRLHRRARRQEAYQRRAAMGLAQQEMNHADVYEYRSGDPMKCPCFLFEPSEFDANVCECSHVLDEHEPAPGGHPGECTVEEES